MKDHPTFGIVETSTPANSQFTPPPTYHEIPSVSEEPPFVNLDETPNVNLEEFGDTYPQQGMEFGTPQSVNVGTPQSVATGSSSPTRPMGVKAAKEAKRKGKKVVSHSNEVRDEVLISIAANQKLHTE